MENIEAQGLDRILDPLGACLTREVAGRLVALRADADTQARVDALAEKANEGLLSTRELAEYEACRSAFHFITVLQAKARRFLDTHPGA